MSKEYYDPKDGFGAIVWASMAFAGLVGIALACCGCRTAGTADQTAKMTWENVNVYGSVIVGGERTMDTTQSAGKDVGVSGVAAQATDNAVGVGGGSATKGQGGSASMEGPR